MAKLNPKQQAFVQEYLIDLNATQPAVWREMVRRWPALSRLCVDEGLERIMREKREA